MSIRRYFGVACLLFLPSLAAAQESASFKLNEHVFNAGGRPEGGAVAGSASYRISLDAIGEAMGATSMASASYGMDAGFVPVYPPPGEVTALVFTDKQTLDWDGEKSAGAYNLYRDLMSNLVGLGFGNCQQQDLPTSTATDNDAVAIGDGFFYLVTAENKLAEEGTKGSQSNGSERVGNACP